MKAKKLVLGLVTAMSVLLFGQAAFANPISLDIANTTFGDIDFSGSNTFSFDAGIGGYDFSVSNQHGFTGQACPGVNCFVAGLNGNLTGTYTISNITGPAGSEYATVSGSGLFILSDGAGHNLTGNLTFLNLSEDSTSQSLNVTGQINVTGLAYSGSNVDLQQMVAQGPNAALALTFQFVPAQDISVLASTAETTSYSGTLAEVPEPGSILLLGSGLLGLAFAGRRRKLQ